MCGGAGWKEGGEDYGLMKWWWVFVGCGMRQHSFCMGSYPRNVVIGCLLSVRVVLELVWFKFFLV